MKARAAVVKTAGSARWPVHHSNWRDACAIRRIANDAAAPGATNGLANSCAGDQTVDALVVDGKRR